MTIYQLSVRHPSGSWLELNAYDTLEAAMLATYPKHNRYWHHNRHAREWLTKSEGFRIQALEHGPNHKESE